MTFRRHKTGILTAVIFLFFALDCSAQQLSISGTVRDADGVVPEASVSLRTVGEMPRVVTTDRMGVYTFRGLTPGFYELAFARPGYDTVIRTLSLTADSTAPIDVTFAIGAVTTSVTVTDVGGKGTAARLDAPDRDLPVLVNSIPQELLQQQGVNDMTLALRNASGVQAQRFYGVYEQYTIRGFNAADVMLVDGMRTEAIFNRFNTQLNNVESIEILKGPSSVLYGGDAVGGAINILRKKPQGTPAYEVFYRDGKFNTHQAAAGVTGPLSGYSLLYRVDASVDYTNGWRGAGSNRLNVSPSLTYLISDRARVTVHQQFIRDNFKGDGGVATEYTLSPDYDPSLRFSLPGDFALIKDSQTHVLFNVNLTPSWEFRNGFLLRRTGEEYLITEGVYFDEVNNEVPREVLYFHHHRRPYVNQAELVGRVNTGSVRHTLLFGYDYRHFSKRTDVTDGDGCSCGFYDVSIDPFSLDTMVETTSPITDFTVARKTFDTNRIHAFFWQDQIDVHRKVKVNVGGRFDDFHRDRHRIFTSDPGNVVGVQTRDQSSYTYRAGAVFAPVPDHQVYFNTSSSFSPILDPPDNGLQLEPQYGRGYEAGYRTQALDGRVHVDFAWYHIEQNNVTFTETLTTVSQAGKQTSKGVDIDVNTILPGRFRILVNYGYTVPKFAEYDNGSDVFTGNQPRFAQKHAANAWLTKSWASGITAGIGARFMGSMFTNNSNTIRMGNWTTMSGSFGVRRGNWQWSLNAENLLDRERYFLGSDYSNQVYPGTPLNVFTTIRYHRQ